MAIIRGEILFFSVLTIAFVIIIHLARFGALARADYAAFLQHVNQPGGASIAHFKFALEIRGRSFAGPHHRFLRFRQQCVVAFQLKFGS